MRQVLEGTRARIALGVTAVVVALVVAVSVSPELQDALGSTSNFAGAMVTDPCSETFLFGDNRNVISAAGSNDRGQRGIGYTGYSYCTNEKFLVDAVGGATQVAVGSRHGLALVGGEVWAWGANDRGQLGDGTTTDRPTAVRVKRGSSTYLSGVTAIAAGQAHSLALLSDGTVRYWGNWTEGKCVGGCSSVSIDTSMTRTYASPVAGLTNVKAVSSGAGHMLALTTNGEVWAWGYGNLGQLGIAGQGDSSVPLRVSGITGATAVAGGLHHSLAVVGGQVRAWGLNLWGEVGDGTTIRRNTPVAVAGLTNIVGVAAGRSHSLAFGSNGNVYAWGANGQRELGDGSDIGRYAPVQVSNVSGALSIAASCGASWAVKSDGAVYEWGASTGATNVRVATSTPGHRLYGVNVKQVAANCYQSFARK